MYDVIIIGGGPAGMSAALNFGRGLKRTLIIDAEQPRNRVTEESHGYLTQDGTSPDEFRKHAQKDVLKYEDVSLEHDRVTNIEKHEGHFVVSTSSRHFKALRCCSPQASGNAHHRSGISESSMGPPYSTAHGVMAMN